MLAAYRCLRTMVTSFCPSCCSIAFAIVSASDSVSVGFVRSTMKLNDCNTRVSGYKITQQFNLNAF